MYHSSLCSIQTKQINKKIKIKKKTVIKNSRKICINHIPFLKLNRIRNNKDKYKLNMEIN